jgi:hypothetical protein
MAGLLGVVSAQQMVLFLRHSVVSTQQPRPGFKDFRKFETLLFQTPIYPIFGNQNLETFQNGLGLFSRSRSTVMFNASSSSIFLIDQALFCPCHPRRDP